MTLDYTSGKVMFSPFDCLKLNLLGNYGSLIRFCPKNGGSPCPKPSTHAWELRQSISSITCMHLVLVLFTESHTNASMNFIKTCHNFLFISLYNMVLLSIINRQMEYDYIRTLESVVYSSWMRIFELIYYSISLSRVKERKGTYMACREQ